MTCRRCMSKGCRYRCSHRFVRNWPSRCWSFHFLRVKGIERWSSWLGTKIRTESSTKFWLPHAKVAFLPSHAMASRFSVSAERNDSFDLENHVANPLRLFKIPTGKLSQAVVGDLDEAVWCVTPQEHSAIHFGQPASFQVFTTGEISFRCCLNTAMWISFYISQIMSFPELIDLFQHLPSPASFLKIPHHWCAFVKHLTVLIISQRLSFNVSFKQSFIFKRSKEKQRNQTM